ncbi:unnamed protein product [Penicillium salamii]|uniref:Uncharacterized protein n=1 Tax=Penicillium salamii TaxID=1612424 RepID=A0A9W4JK09_9EURO|nr:unnamed protein product [Penicillium salamii]CAG8176149.1 unnamed protein product [Penicillium salamii]CAG8198936.1 unnamed protein product [Penicillium salamii]CAG8282808.1 unnamed protein product [Penicillium salamii]CAG8362246.1 unnamed protein product [Penicillium salamii]
MDSPPQLIIAAKQGRPEVTAALLQRGADPNCRMNFFGRPDASNTTPLHIAAADGHTEIAVQLLEYGASIDAVANAFSTPLCEAAKSGEESMVSLLLESGAQVDGDRRAQATPLIEAAWSHQNEVMRILLDYGADVDCRDQDGDPVLVSLAEVGNLSMIQTILSLYGEDMDCEGGSRMPAWWFAQRNGHLEVATVLRDWYQQRTTQPGRSFPVDLRDDSNLSLAEIGEEKFVRDVEIAQDAIYTVGGSSDWKKLVRFMVEVEDPEYQVEVIEPYKQDDSDDQPFVAVSYVWASQEADPSSLC